MQTAMESYCWMFKELDSAEEEKLKKYILSKSRTTNDGKLVVTRDIPPRWAIITWTKE
jgi:hypothetical protein